jgi:hypothetical protein
MAVRISREPGRFSVVLAKVGWLDPLQFAPGIASALGVPRPDATRICRLQRGILFEGALHEQANAVADMLNTQGVAATVAPDAELPLIPKPVQVSIASLDEQGFATPSMSGAGMPRLWPWEDLALVCGGILIGPEAQAAALVDKVDQQVLEEADDRRSFAARALEKAKTRVFPLRQEIERPEKEVADALQSALAGKGSEPEVQGFGRVSTVLDLVFTRPYERLRLAGSSRVTSLRRSSSSARDLHAAVVEIVRRATSATVPGATLALVHGADSGDYVFEDLNQFDSHCRWAYYWRLQRQAD